MKKTSTLILVAALAAGAFVPASGAQAGGWRSMADTYLTKARTWTSDGFDKAEESGYLTKSQKQKLTGQGGQGEGLSAGQTFSNNANASPSNGQNALSGRKKLSSRIPKSIQ